MSLWALTYRGCMSTEVEAKRRARAPSKARIRRALEDVVAGHETLASVSRGFGYRNNYLQTRARRDPEIREMCDAALIARSETWLDEAAGVGSVLQGRIQDLILAVDAGESKLTAADIDRLSRSLTNIVDVFDRTATAARQRDDARAGRGDSAGELFAALAARWGPAGAPAQLEGETA